MQDTTGTAATTPELIAALQAKADTDSWFAREIVRRATILGADVDGEGPHFRIVRAAEFLGRDGWTVSQVQMAAA